MQPTMEGSVENCSSRYVLQVKQSVRGAEGEMDIQFHCGTNNYPVLLAIRWIY